MRNAKSAKVFLILALCAAVAALAGCAGMMAESRYKDEAAAKYVFNTPAEKLLDETAAYLNGGTFGAAMAGAVVEVDRGKLTAAGPWKAGKLLRSRTSARITRVDDSHSTLVMNNETQTIDSKTGEWGKSSFSRTSAYEIEVIKRLDPQTAAEIEAGAKKAAEDAKKK
jgi:hypothetical protein